MASMIKYYLKGDGWPITQLNLPNRIRLSNGLTRTDNTTYNHEDILSAGYIEVSAPPEVEETQTYSWVDGEWIIENI